MDAGMLIGAYRVEELLGRGGMAEVYRVWHTGLHRMEAMKVLSPQMTYDNLFVERFLKEARIVASLHHDNIATIYSVSEPNSPCPFFTMELVEDGDLAEILERHEHLSNQQIVSLLQQVGSALDYAHDNGIIHRDVKPANILLAADGYGGWRAKVVDFGIARAQESEGSRLTRAGMVIGTPEYMSPEQGGSGTPIDHRTDIYSLGIIAYEIFCGHPPFRSDVGKGALSVLMAHLSEPPRPPIQILPDIPSAVNSAILKALEKNPADRFDSCTKFVAALSRGYEVSISPVQKSSSSSVQAAQREVSFRQVTKPGYSAGNNSLYKRLITVLAAVGGVIGLVLVCTALFRRPVVNTINSQQNGRIGQIGQIGCTGEAAIQTDLSRNHQEISRLGDVFHRLLKKDYRFRYDLDRLPIDANYPRQVDLLTKRQDAYRKQLKEFKDQFAPLEAKLSSALGQTDHPGCSSLHEEVAKDLARTYALHFGVSYAFKSTSHETQQCQQSAEKLDSKAIPTILEEIDAIKHEVINGK